MSANPRAELIADVSAALDSMADPTPKYASALLTRCRQALIAEDQDAKRLDWLDEFGCGARSKLNATRSIVVWRNTSIRSAIDAKMPSDAALSPEDRHD